MLFSWLGIVLQTERLQAQLLVSAHAWIVGSIPSQGMYKRQLIDVSLSLSPSLPLSLESVKEKKTLKKIFEE